jgi:hypothetical protein
VLVPLLVILAVWRLLREPEAREGS